MDLKIANIGLLRSTTLSMDFRNTVAAIQLVGHMNGVYELLSLHNKFEPLVLKRQTVHAQNSLCLHRLFKVCAVCFMLLTI